MKVLKNIQSGICGALTLVVLSFSTTYARAENEIKNGGEGITLAGKYYTMTELGLAPTKLPQDSSTSDISFKYKFFTNLNHDLKRISEDRFWEITKLNKQKKELMNTVLDTSHYEKLEVVSPDLFEKVFKLAHNRVDKKQTWFIASNIYIFVQV